MKHHSLSSVATGVITAAVFAVGGVTPAMAATDGNDPVQNWSSLSEETQKLFDYRTAHGLPNGESWQKTCFAFGALANSDGAAGIIATIEDGDALTTTETVRFSNPRSEIVSADNGQQYNMFVVTTEVCHTPAPTPSSAPSYVDNPGKSNDYIVIPAGYSFHNEADITMVLPAGNYKIPESAYVNGTANVTLGLSQTNFTGSAQYEINPNLPSSWSYEFDGRTPVYIENEPSPYYGMFDDDTFTVPESEGFSWHIGSADGPVIGEGTYSFGEYANYDNDGYVNVDLYPVVDNPAEYTLADSNPRSLSAQNFEYAQADEPTISDGKMNDDVLTLPDVVGGHWTVNGDVLDAGEYRLDDLNAYNADGDASVSVSLDADEGYKFPSDGVNSDSTNGGVWNLEARNYETTSVPSIDVHDGDGPSDDYYVLPDVEGVSYFSSDGNEISAGKHFATGSVKVNIEAKDGYKFENGETSTEFTTYLDPLYLAGEVVAPSMNDNDGLDNDSIVLTKAAGINWTINGKSVDAGTYKVSDLMDSHADSFSARVAYTLTDGYRLREGSAFGPWTKTFDTRVTVPDSSLTVTPKDNDGPDDVVIIPSVDGISWTVNGKSETAGSVHVVGHADVVAKTMPGYVLGDGLESRTFTFSFDTTYVSDSPSSPSIEDKPGTLSDTFEIADLNGVTWTVNGNAIASGVFKVSNYAKYVDGVATLNVEAFPADGFHLPDGATSKFQVSFTERTKVSAPESPKFEKSTIVIPQGQQGIAYYLVSANGEMVPVSGTIVAPTFGDVLIQAEAVTGFTFDGSPASWTHSYDLRQRVAVKAPTFTKTSDGGVVTIPSIEGVSWTIDGVAVKSGDNKVAAKKVVVKAQASSDDVVLTGTTSFEFDATPPKEKEEPLSNNGNNDSKDVDVTTNTYGGNTDSDTDNDGNVEASVSVPDELRKTGSPIQWMLLVSSLLLAAGAASVASGRKAKVTA